MTTPPDPTGVRRLEQAVLSCMVQHKACGKHLLGVNELDAALAAVRVAELERVVAGTRELIEIVGEMCGMHGTMEGLRLEDFSEYVDKLFPVVDRTEEALAALDAPAKEGR